MKLVIGAVFLWTAILWACALQAHANVGQEVELNVDATFGSQTFSPNTIFLYREPDATRSDYTAQSVIKLPPSATNVAVDFSDFFPAGATPLVIGASDIGLQSSGFDIGLESGGQRVHITEGGFSLMRVEGSAIVYLDNPSNTQALFLKMFGVSKP